jgi:hypothetical protein
MLKVNKEGKLTGATVARPDIDEINLNPVINHERASRGFPNGPYVKTSPNMSQAGVFTYSDVCVTTICVQEGTDKIVRSYVGPLIFKGTLRSAIEAHSEAIRMNEEVKGTNRIGAFVLESVQAKEQHYPGFTGMGVSDTEMEAYGFSPQLTLAYSRPDNLPPSVPEAQKQISAVG